KSQVSRLCEEIDERVQAFLNRPLEGDWPFLWLDATYVKLREGDPHAICAPRHRRMQFQAPMVRKPRRAAHDDTRSENSRPRRFSSIRTWRIPRDDLVSEGLLGVCEGIEKFDPARGDMVGIVYRLVQSRLNALSHEMSRPVSAYRSRREAKMRWHLSRKIQEYEQQGYGSTRALELAARDLGVSPDHAEAAMAMRSAVPFDCGDDEDESRQFADDAPPVENALDADRVKRVLAEAMEGLDEREIYIMQRRLGEDPPALDSLAEELSISRGRVGQIQREARCASGSASAASRIDLA
ncbi:MAG: transposase, partial [Rhodobacteraceae bacterium]|nr:transposase [Paracoccaceae bacterium]